MNSTITPELLGINLPKIEAFSALPHLTPTDVANAEAPGAWPRPKFPKDHLGFFTDLKKRVNNYFTTTKISDRDSWRMYVKSAVMGSTRSRTSPTRGIQAWSISASATLCSRSVSAKRASSQFLLRISTAKR